MRKDLLSSEDVALKLNYTKWHILSVAKMHDINPAIVIKTGHGNPNYLWTPEQVKKLKKHLGGKPGRPLGSKNKKILDKIASV